MAQLLLINGDPTFNGELKKALQRQSYTVDTYYDAEHGYLAFRRKTYDLCIISISLNGLELLTNIRTKNGVIPVFVLTENKSMDQTDLVFQAGADQYEEMPLSIAELVMRVDVFLKRTPPPHQDALFQIGKFRLNTLTKQLLTENGKVFKELSEMEAKFLAYLCRNTNRLLPRQEILLNVWGKSNFFAGRSMDVFISRTRKLLKETHIGEITTIHGTGFQFDLFGTADGPGEIIELAKLHKKPSQARLR